MQTVAETQSFIRQAEALFTPEEKDLVVEMIAFNPLAGDEIPGTGGVRKLRFAAKGKGKSGGARVIYFWYSLGAPIYLLLAYGKGSKSNLSPEDARIVTDFANAMKTRERNRRRWRNPASSDAT